jgi:hypothetical protein
MSENKISVLKNDDQLLKAIAKSASSGLTPHQVAMDLGIDYNEFMQMWMSDSNIKLAYNTGLVEKVKQKVAILEGLSLIPGKQQMASARDLLRYYQGLLHGVNPATTPEIKSAAITVVSQETMAAIEDHEKRQNRS